MKTYILDPNTGNYLAEDGTWSSKRSQARNFTSSMEALKCLPLAGIEAADLMLDFGDPASDVIVPIRPVSPRAATNSAGQNQIGI